MTDAERTAALAAAVVLLRKREKATARVLLAAELVTRTAARKAVAHALGQASLDVLEEESPARTVSRLHAATPLLIAALAGAFVLGSHKAQAKAREHAKATPKARHPLIGTDLETYAQVTATSIASSWTSRMTSALRLGGKDVGAALRAARKPLDASVDRAAATETALAFNGELLELHRDPYRSPAPAANDAPEAAPDEDWIVWSAILDAKTCADCRYLDGTAIRADEAFPLGAPPLHPFCRCVPVHLRLPAGLKPKEIEAAIADEPRAPSRKAA